MIFRGVGGWKAKSRAGGASLGPKAFGGLRSSPRSSPQLC